MGPPHTVDLGDGGVRVLEADTAPLSCADIAIGDAVEINGRDDYRAGTVAEKGEYLHEGDGDYFPCMVAAGDVQVGVGDFGGAVLVRGVPAGVTTRSFGGLLGFSPSPKGSKPWGWSCARRRTAASTGHSAHDVGPRSLHAPDQLAAGSTLWLRRKTLSGSQVRLRAASRATLASP